MRLYKIIQMMPAAEYTMTIKQTDHSYKTLCLFLPITDTVKYRKSQFQFYVTNHKSHQNAMCLTDNKERQEKKKYFL